MPIRVPGVNGAPVSANAVEGVANIVPSQAQQITGRQLSAAGNALMAAGGPLIQGGQGLIDQANDAASRQQATRHGIELDKLVRGYEEQRAATAHNGFKSALEDIDKLRGQFSKHLKNPQQAELYGRMVDAQVAQAKARAEKHYHRETFAWNVEQTEVNIGRFAEEYRTAAALPDADDDERTERMAVARGVMLKEFDRLAQLRGLDAKTAAAIRDEKLAKLHGETLDTLADQNPEQARDYFETFSDEMSAKTRARAKRVLDAADLKDRALAKSRELMASAGEDATPAQRMQAVMDGAAKITDADEFNAVLSFAGAEYRRLVEVDAMRDNELLGEVEALKQQTPDGLFGFDQLKPSLQEELRERGLVDDTLGILGRADAANNTLIVQRALRDGTAFKSIPKPLFDRTYKWRMSKDQFAVLESVWAEVNPEAAAAAMPQGTPVASVLTFKDAFNAAMKENGLAPEEVEGDVELTRQSTAMWEALQRLIDQGRLTKEMTYKQQKEEIDALFSAKAVIEGFVWDSTVPIEAAPQGAKIPVTTRDGRQIMHEVGAVPSAMPGSVGEMGVREWIKQELMTGENAIRNPSEQQIAQVWYELGTPRTSREAQRAAEAQAPARRAIAETVAADPQVTDFVTRQFQGARLMTMMNPEALQNVPFNDAFAPREWTAEQRRQAAELFEALKQLPGRAPRVPDLFRR